MQGGRSWLHWLSEKERVAALPRADLVFLSRALNPQMSGYCGTGCYEHECRVAMQPDVVWLPKAPRVVRRVEQQVVVTEKERKRERETRVRVGQIVSRWGEREKKHRHAKGSAAGGQASRPCRCGLSLDHHLAIVLWVSSLGMRASYSLVLVLLLYLDSLTLVTLAASNNPHLCRCTCFVTNTTILPLFSPLDPHNPCSTCTRQFCLSQGLEACRGARIERPDADTGTGWEGEVWAKCLRK